MDRHFADSKRLTPNGAMASKASKDVHYLECENVHLTSFLHALYRKSFVSSQDERHFRRDGRWNDWALDLKTVLSQYEYLVVVASEIGEMLRKKGITQVVGGGIGAACLIGGIVSQNLGFCGGLIREIRKEYGFRRRIEGALLPSEPIAVVDDIVSSGRTAVAAIQVLRNAGFQVRAVATVFVFGWRTGSLVLTEQSVQVLCLAKIQLAERSQAGLPQR